MADNPLNVNNFRQTTVHDLDGRPVLIIGSRTFHVLDDESDTEHENTDYIQLVDGVAWTPAMLSGPNPIMLTTCALCRNPKRDLLGRKERPSHGLLCVRNCRNCGVCGRNLCAQHRVLSDGRWFCHSCYRMQLLKRALRSVFFRRMET